MRAIVYFSVALGLTACGPGTVVNGTVKGNALNVVDSMFVYTGGAVSLILADKPNLCATIVANRFPKNMTYISFNVNNTAAGDYTIGAGAQVFFAKLDDQCKGTFATEEGAGKSGLIKFNTLTATANGYANGTFDVTVGPQLDKLTGSFSTKFCVLPSTLPMTAPSCE